MSGAEPGAPSERLQQVIPDVHGRHERELEAASTSALDSTKDGNQLPSRLESLLLDIKELDLTDEVQGELIDTFCGGCADIHIWALADGSCVAEKRIRFNTQDDLHKVSKRVARELRIWFGLKHPNVLPLKGYIKRTNYRFPSIVTDWMKRGSLQQFLKHTAHIDEIEMIKGITDGLYYLHSKNVVHGDLKAANVVISQDRIPMLMDFGISHLLGGTSTVETATGGYKGSVRWLAPELMFPEGQQDVCDVHTKNSDIWALGMTWLEVLTKKVPYAHLAMDHQVVGMLFQKALPRTPDDRESWSESKKRIWKLCLLCWCIDAAWRPPVEILAREVYLTFTERERKKRVLKQLGHRRKLEAKIEAQAHARELELAEAQRQREQEIRAREEELRRKQAESADLERRRREAEEEALRRAEQEEDLMRHVLLAEEDERRAEQAQKEREADFVEKRRRREPELLAQKREQERLEHQCKPEAEIEDLEQRRREAEEEDARRRKEEEELAGLQRKKEEELGAEEEEEKRRRWEIQQREENLARMRKEEELRMKEEEIERQRRELQAREEELARREEEEERRRVEEQARKERKAAERKKQGEVERRHVEQLVQRKKEKELEREREREEARWQQGKTERDREEQQFQLRISLLREQETEKKREYERDGSSPFPGPVPSSSSGASFSRSTSSSASNAHLGWSANQRLHKNPAPVSSTSQAQRSPASSVPTSNIPRMRTAISASSVQAASSGSANSARTVSPYACTITGSRDKAPVLAAMNAGPSPTHSGSLSSTRPSQLTESEWQLRQEELFREQQEQFWREREREGQVKAPIRTPFLTRASSASKSSPPFLWPTTDQ